MPMDYQPYTSVVVQGEINLRNEIDLLFSGEKHAHWVVYRRFNLSAPTTNLVEITQEAVQGEKYEFTDELTDVRMSHYTPGVSRFLEESAHRPGLLVDGMVVFYVRHSLLPRTVDKIFEITYQGKPSVVPSPSDFLVSYDIISVLPMRDLDYGRVEYYILLCRVSNRG